MELRTTKSSHYLECSDNKKFLRKRQHAVLLCMARGMSDKETADAPGIKVDTVRYHKRNLYVILAAHGNVDAVVKALQCGLISIDEI